MFVSRNAFCYIPFKIRKVNELRGKTEENIGTEDTSDMMVYVDVDDTLSSCLVQKIGRSWGQQMNTTLIP